MITPTLISHFQHDDHPTHLTMVAHEDIDIYPFQVALQDTSAMLHEIVRSHVLPFNSLMVQSYPQM